MFEATERNSTKLDGKPQLPRLQGRSENKDGQPGMWLVETFSTSLKPPNKIWWNLTGSKFSPSSIMFVFLGANRTFSTSLPQVLNKLWRNFTVSNYSTSFIHVYQFVVFGWIGKQKWPPWHHNGLDISNFSSATAERNWIKLDKSNCSTSSTKFADPSSDIWLADSFSTSLMQYCWTEFDET